jgi:hypothetical protein
MIKPAITAMGINDNRTQFIFCVIHNTKIIITTASNDHSNIEFHISCFADNNSV